MKKFTLYPYQEKIGELILAGHNVILQAPTGAGKTAAALLPFLHARRHLPNEEFPRKCIYSVPMRVLANQFVEEYKKHVARFGLQHELEVTIQTGDQPGDPQLEGDLIFTTIDQTLSNFLCIPYALGNGRANINAGAVAAAYLVFDEFHLYDPKTALPTTLHMLKMLKGITPFLLMTATFSNTMLTELAEELGAVIVPETNQARMALQAIPSQQKMRHYQTVNASLTAEAIVAQHPQQGRSIAICNTVQRAQDLFEALDRIKPAGVEVKLLHSRFYQEHRQVKEAWLRREFGKDRSAYTVNSAILIATQVIEVGLDITCDVLHTELAPANAILQRAGRCARYQGEKGMVYLYQLPLNKSGEVNYQPYHNNGQKEICDLTWQAFSHEARNGQVFNFIEEQAVLSEVHEPSDAALLQKLQDDRFVHKEMMELAMGAQERGLARDLIRDVNSRNVIVHPNPNGDVDEKEPWRLKNPWRWESFSLFTGSVYGAFKTLQELADEVDHYESCDCSWVMMRLDRKESDEEWGGKEISYLWKPVSEQSALEGALLVAIHPRLATYDEERGLRIGVPGGTDWVVWERKSKPGLDDDGPYTYRQETYQEHIAGLYRAYSYALPDKARKVMRQPLAQEMAYVFARAENRFGLPAGTLDRAAHFIIAGHDLGKLGQAWQDWAHRWQQVVKQEVSLSTMLAHTDYDASAAQKKMQKKLGPRPNHAAESAFGLIDLAWEVAGDESLYRAINAAIARHHNAGHRGSVESFRIDPHGVTALQGAFADVGLNYLNFDQVQWEFKAGEDLRRELVEPQSHKQMLLYFFLARVLRLADQRSQKG
ncbi:MAG: CRISPR-associated helicase Cas3' [Chloroflexota bacterium]